MPCEGRRVLPEQVTGAKAELWGTVDDGSFLIFKLLVGMTSTLG